MFYFFKKHYQTVCAIIAIITIMFLGYPCIEMTGENYLGGIGYGATPCFTSMTLGCSTSILGQIFCTPCDLSYIACIGVGEGSCTPISAACVAWYCNFAENFDCSE
jgi:hypothetical protein